MQRQSSPPQALFLVMHHTAQRSWLPHSPLPEQAKGSLSGATGAGVSHHHGSSQQEAWNASHPTHMFDVTALATLAGTENAGGGTAQGARKPGKCHRSVGSLRDRQARWECLTTQTGNLGMICSKHLEREITLTRQLRLLVKASSSQQEASGS